MSDRIEKAVEFLSEYGLIILVCMVLIAGIIHFATFDYNNNIDKANELSFVPNREIYVNIYDNCEKFCDDTVKQEIYHTYYEINSEADQFSCHCFVKHNSPSVWRDSSS